MSWESFIASSRKSSGNIKRYTALRPSVGDPLAETELIWRMQGSEDVPDGSLPALEEGLSTLLILRKNRPPSLSTEEGRQLDLLDRAVITAVESSSVPDTREALVAYDEAVIGLMKARHQADIRDSLAGLAPRERMASLKLRVDDIIGFPAHFASAGIKLDLDTLGYTESDTEAGFIVASGARLTLDERVRDL